MHSVAEKVTAFVTRTTAQGAELLLFEHPRAGIQLPAGTVEDNELHATAAAREAREETGLLHLPPSRFLEAVSEPLPEDHYLMLATTTAFARPDTTSFDWATIRRRILVRRHRTVADFSHVTFAEEDTQADPPYVSYQITGWVPTAMITRQATRYFYHFPYQGETPTTWWVDTDNHRFRLFWAPLVPLPLLVGPQRWWLDILLRASL